MIVVVGAGLIGLAIAYELARRGANVRVFDRGDAGAAASWAGAGMLAPCTEAIASTSLRELCVRSLELYPEFVSDVQRDGGVDARLRLDGIVNLAASDGDAELLRARVAAMANEGGAAAWLSRAQTLAIEPATAGSIAGAAMFEGEGHVDNRRLVRGLLAACERRGVDVQAQCGTLEVEVDARRVRGVRTRAGFVAADAVVNAAGAWASALAGIPRHAAVDVYPVKGQMLALAMPRGLVHHPVWFAGGYVVPRDDGRLLVGATVEHAGFDVRVTAAGARALLDAALAALPALRDLAICETWAGVRPGTRDGLPFLGPTALGGYIVATGHFRNGILLAPATATLLADLIEQRTPTIDPRPFSPQRDAGADGGDAAANWSA